MTASVCASYLLCDSKKTLLCYGCNKTFRKEHSSMRPWGSYMRGSWNERQHRICDECWTGKYPGELQS